MLYVKFDHKQELTHRTLAELIAEGDDERPRQLRVKKSGEVRLTHYADHSDLDLYQIAYPTWAPDSNSCGFDAAHDVVWIGQIYRSLTRRWKQGFSGVVNLPARGASFQLGADLEAYLRQRLIQGPRVSLCRSVLVP